jgi:hypothetical protein
MIRELRNIKTSRRILIIVISVFVAVCLCGAIGGNTAIANDSISTSAVSRVDVKLNVVDSSGKATTKLDRDYYVNGDEVVLTWKGSNEGKNLIIPTSITYGEKTIDVSQLIRTDFVQAANSEYERRMGQAATLCDYKILKKYVEKEHNVSLGILDGALSVTVNYEMVTPVYRLYNKITSEHLFTSDKTEYENFVAIGKEDKDYWIGEGVAWLAPSSGTTVQRLYNEGLGAKGHSSHYYTADTAEIESLKTQGWVVDNGGQEFSSGGTNPIWTCYNEALGSAHHYTSSLTEWEGLSAHGWDLEVSKNGDNGAFQAVVDLNWSFDQNYYTVEHKVGDEVIDTQVVAAVAGQQTDAKEISYPGYDLDDISNAKVSSQNSTVATVDYEARSFEVTYDKNGEGIAWSLIGKYLSKIKKPSTPNSNGKNFIKWTYDQEGNYEFDFDNTKILAGSLKLYAQWQDIDATATDKKVKVTFNYGKVNKKADVIEINYNSSVTPPDTTGLERFDGWYTLPNGNGEKWDFNTKIKKSFTLFANWISPDKDNAENDN